MSMIEKKHMMYTLVLPSPREIDIQKVIKRERENLIARGRWYIGRE